MRLRWLAGAASFCRRAQLSVELRIPFAYTLPNGAFISFGTQATQKKYFLLSFPKRLLFIHKRFVGNIAFVSRPKLT